MLEFLKDNETKQPTPAHKTLAEWSLHLFFSLGLPPPCLNCILIEMGEMACYQDRCPQCGRVPPDRSAAKGSNKRQYFKKNREQGKFDPRLFSDYYQVWSFRTRLLFPWTWNYRSLVPFSICIWFCCQKHVDVKDCDYSHLLFDMIVLGRFGI